MKNLQSLCRGQQGEKVITEREEGEESLQQRASEEPQHQRDNQAKVLSTVEGRRIIDMG